MHYIPIQHSKTLVHYEHIVTKKVYTTHYVNLHGVLLTLHGNFISKNFEIFHQVEMSRLVEEVSVTLHISDFLKIKSTLFSNKTF